MDRPCDDGSSVPAMRDGVRFVALALAAVAIGGPPAVADDVATRGIGGKWLVRDGEKPVYLFRDGTEEVDLFSNHCRDSNDDGTDEVSLTHDRDHLVMRSQGYPNHPTAIFPNSGNPNTIRVQDFTFRLPLVPRRADEITRLPMGPIGVALNGVVFFNPFEQGGMNAVAGYAEVWLDSCCGHPQQTGVYHYHKYPTCVKSPFADDGRRHSPVIGFAFDGYPIHGPYESAGVFAMDLEGDRALDVCNGHADDDRGYHYHVTPGRFPYVIGGYRGVPEPSNNRGLARAGTGPIIDSATVDRAAGTNDLGAVIAEVRPGSVPRGGRREVTLRLDPAKSSRGPVPPAAPAWVQIGPYEAVAIRREGDAVTIAIDVPDDATLGVLLDCHLEFELGQGPRRGARVFKRNDVLRIVE